MCKILNFPSIPTNFSLPEFVDAWELDFSGRTLRDMDSVAPMNMLVSFVVSSVVSHLFGLTKMQHIYERDAYTHRISQQFANLIFWLWMLSKALSKRYARRAVIRLAARTHGVKWLNVWSWCLRAISAGGVVFLVLAFTRELGKSMLPCFPFRVVRPPD